MTDTPKLVLRYFAARGRAQFLRYYFRIRDIAFVDEEVELSPDFAAWMAIRSDRAVAGPFQKLPVLHCDDQLIAEALVIAAFLHQRFGDERSLSASQNLQHAMLLSSLYGDVMMPIGTLVWADIAFVGVDIAALAKRTLERMSALFHNLERTLIEWQWFAQMDKRPITLADCLLWEEISIAQHVFGAHLPLGSWPELARFDAEFAGRAICERELAKPRPVTGRPGEPDVIAKLQQALATGK
jgi:glutathione S-transferase